MFFSPASAPIVEMITVCPPGGLFYGITPQKEASWVSFYYFFYRESSLKVFPCVFFTRRVSSVGILLFLLFLLLFFGHFVKLPAPYRMFNVDSEGWLRKCFSPIIYKHLLSLCIVKWTSNWLCINRRTKS